GGFTNVNGTPIHAVARLLPDGALDPTFSRGIGPSQDALQIRRYADGRYLIGGSFTNFDGAPRTNLARLMPNGQLDESFLPPPGTPPQVFFNPMAVQADGKVLVGGPFFFSNIVRLTVSGSRDATFTGPVFTNAALIYPVLQKDGRILVGGTY